MGTRRYTNKAFAVCVRTPQTSDRGVTHIIEHTTLCGSDRFTTKEPFANLLRTSFQNFLNALTYPETTAFPFATTNLADYFNIARVYLDAVFRPRVRHDPFPFYQEGFRWQVNDDGSVEPNGIIYNEMKDLEKGVDNITTNALLPKMYRGTYQYVNGGESHTIKTTTHEQLIEFYTQHYHPTNTMTVLYSPAEMLEDELRTLAEYFNGAGVGTVYDPVDAGFPGTPDEVVEVQYPVDDEAEQKDVFVCAWRLPEITPEERIALQIAQSILFNVKGSIFFERVTEKGIGRKVSSRWMEFKWDLFEVVVRDAVADRFEDFKQLIDDELRRVAREGFEQARVDASFNSIVFAVNDALLDSNRGLNFIEGLTESYRDRVPDLLESLRILQVVETVRRKVPEGIMQDVVRWFFDDNPQRMFVHARPKAGLMDEWTAANAEHYAAVAAGMSEEDKQHWRELNARLQDTPDTPEQEATIPKLTLKEIETVTVDHSFRHLDAPIDVNYIPHASGSIVYARYTFDMTEKSLYELFLVKMLTVLLLNVDTTHHTFPKLNTRVNSNFGTLYFMLSSFVPSKYDATYEDTTRAKFIFHVRFSAFVLRLPQCVELIHEIFESSVFSTTRVQRKLNEFATSLETHIRNDGNNIFSEMDVLFSPVSHFLEPITAHNLLHCAQAVLALCARF